MGDGDDTIDRQDQSKFGDLLEGITENENVKHFMLHENCCLLLDLNS